MVATCPYDNYLLFIRNHLKLNQNQLAFHALTIHARNDRMGAFDYVLILLLLSEWLSRNLYSKSITYKTHTKMCNNEIITAL